MQYKNICSCIALKLKCSEAIKEIIWNHHNKGCWALLKKMESGEAIKNNASCSSATKKLKISDDSGVSVSEIEEELSGNEEDDQSLWWAIPDLVLLKIMSLLTTKDITNISATCHRWYGLANDDIMWKHRFQKHFRTDPAISLRPGKFDLIFLTIYVIFCVKVNTTQ